MSFRTDINGLRGVAVLLVVLYHLGVPGFQGGYVGVDVFFVISGYLMTRAVTGKLAKGTFSTLDFYAARARRLLPALIALNVVLLAGGFFALLPLAYQALSESIFSSVTFVSNIAFWQERGYFDAPSQTKWLLHTWSLSVEWQFYLLYPLFLLALAKLKGGKHLLAGVVVALVVSLALSIGATPWKQSASFFLLPTRAWEMLLGGVIALRGDAWPKRDWLVWGGLALIVGATIGFDEGMPYPGWYAVVPVVGAALVVAARGAVRLLEGRALQLFGDVSYSFYLWHWPFIVGARVFTPDRAAEPLVLLGVALASFIVALVSHRYIEEPFRTRGAGLGASAYLGRCAAPIAVVAATAAIVVVTHGLPSRVPPLVAQNDAVSGEFAWDSACDEGSHPCSIGPEQAGKVLFWGDSHMEQLYPAVEELVRRGATRGLQPVFFAAKACIPVRGFSDPLAETGCPGMNEAAFVRAHADDVEAVVLASIWTQYFHAKIYDAQSRPTLCTVVDGRCVKSASSEAALTAVGERLRADLGALTARGKRVYLVAPVPVFQRDIASYMAEHAWNGDAPDLVLTRAEHNALVAQVKGMLHQVASATNAVVLDPADILCANEERCIYQVDGVTLYRDDNHLTIAGAKLLAEELEAPFRRP